MTDDVGAATREARPGPDRRPFYGVATVSLPVFAVLLPIALILLLAQEFSVLVALAVAVAAVAGIAIARHRWRAVAGLALGLLLAIPASFFTSVVAGFSWGFR